MVQVHLDKLAKLPAFTEGDAAGVSAFSTAINNIVWTFQDLGYLDDLNAASNVKAAVEKLPPAMSLKWNEHLIAKVIARPTLIVLGDWLQQQADAHELLPRRTKLPTVRPERRPNSAEHRANSFAVHDTAPCPLGDGYHSISSCPKFASMTVDERAETVKEAQLCFRCLERGHRSRECKISNACGVDNCQKKHHHLLHLAKRVYPSPEEHSKSSHNLRQAQVLLQVVPVVLHGPAKAIETFAMLDLGSTCSLIHSDVAKQLGLEGPTETMVLNGILQRNSVLTRKVSFGVSPQGSSERWTVEQVKTVDSLNLPNTKVDMSKEKSRWPHLTDLPLPYIDASQVTVLFGADVFDLIVPQEIRTTPNS